jgi:ectoine hydroxylase-related dioxygenase (phytanoyl-CoA dioxygenase family)
MKKMVKDMFFNLRMNFGIKIFSFKKSSGYYSQMKSALEGLKKDGYCKLEKYYTDAEINEIQNECLSILDQSEEIFLKNKNIKDSLERVSGEIKIKHIHKISNKLKVYSNEFFFTLISLFFCGKPRIPTVFFHLIHDGNFIHKSVPGKSEVRIGGQWHYDSLDHILKCFILLDDITPETGGETRIINGSRQKLKKIKNDEEKKYGEYATNDEVLEKEDRLKQLNILNDKTIKNLYGKKGDVFFIDTSNLHRGALLKKGIKRCIWLYF